MYDAEELEERIRAGEIGADDRVSLAGGPQKRFWEFPRFAELRPADADSSPQVTTPPRVQDAAARTAPRSPRVAEERPATRPRAPRMQEDAVDLRGMAGGAKPGDPGNRGRSDNTMQQKRRRRAASSEPVLPSDPAPPRAPAERRAAHEDEAVPSREPNDAGFESEDSARRAEAIRRRYGTDPRARAVKSDTYRGVGTGQRQAVEPALDPERADKRRRSRELIEEARRRQEDSDAQPAVHDERDSAARRAAAGTPPPRQAVAGRPRTAASTPRGSAAVFDRRPTSGSHPIVGGDFERTPSGRHKHVSGIQSALDPRAHIEPSPFPERMLDGGLHGLREELQLLPLPEILGVAFMTPRPLITRAYHRRCQHVDEVWDSLLPEVRSMPVKVDILRILQMAHETLTDPAQHKTYGDSAHVGGQLEIFREYFDFVSTETRMSGEHRTAADEMLETAGFDLKQLYGDVQKEERRERDAAAKKRAPLTPYQLRIRTYTVLIVVSAALAAWSLSKGC